MGKTTIDNNIKTWNSTEANKTFRFTKMKLKIQLKIIEDKEWRKTWAKLQRYMPKDQKS